MMSSRLDRVRARMATLGVDLLLVRSTDPYLNEYVPPPLALRPWLTGFTGSMGEALLAADRAWLFVDGRYWLQAESEVDPEVFQVVRVTLSSGLDGALFQEIERQAARAPGPLRVGFEADRVTLAERRDWESRLPAVQWVPSNPSPVAEARREADGPEDLSSLDGPIRSIPREETGHGVLERLQAVFSALPDSVDRVWVQKLDEVAWLTGLRGQGLPHQATFRGAALAARDRIWLGLDGSPSLPEAMDPHVEVVPRAELPSLCLSLIHI